MKGFAAFLRKNVYLAIVIGAALLAVLLGKVVFLYAAVPTDSMAPYIDAGRAVVAVRLRDGSAEIKRGDVILFKKEELTDSLLVKRVVGLPGEAVEIVRGDVYIDGARLDEPYVELQSDESMDGVRVPEGRYFVLGDNRRHSSDSSDWADRYVGRGDILARELFVIGGKNRMQAIIEAIALPLGYIVRWCNGWLPNYGWALIVFTLFTKLILFPVNLLVQKNSVKMVQMKPKMDELRFKYVDDPDMLVTEQFRLYRQENYRPFLGVVPLLIQIPIIFGLIDVIYKPLKYIVGLSQTETDLLIDAAARFEPSILSLSSPQMRVVQLFQDAATRPWFDAARAQLASLRSEQLAQGISGLRLDFFGVDLAQIPRLGVPDALWLIPLLAGLSAWLLCYAQNRVNVLQIEQSKLSQWSMTAFMILFSTAFAFVVPCGVGLYWIAGNLLSIPVLYLLNAVYDPKKYIDYSYLESIKRIVEEKRRRDEKNKGRERRDYKRFHDKANSESMRLVFYSEQSGFYKYFESLIEALGVADPELKIHYVTNDPDDIVFSLDKPNIVPYYIGEKKIIPLMMHVVADIVVMTVPDLEKYQIKRSKYRPDVEYIYTDHGITSLNLAYRTGALDHFDTIFAVNQLQVDEIRALEKLRHTKKKAILKCGYGLEDRMIAMYDAMEKRESEKKTVLIAPSWQEDNILDSCLDGLLESLMKTDWRVIVRPHPQYIRRFPVKMQAILDRYRDREGEDLVFEMDFSSNETVYTADALVTDWSSIGYEYCLTTCKPVVFINTKMKVINPDWEAIDVTPMEIEARRVVGVEVEKQDVGGIDTVIAGLFASRDEYAQKILKLRDRYLFNVGGSGAVGARYILSRFKK